MLPIGTSSLNDGLARPALLSILVSGQFGARVEGEKVRRAIEERKS